MEKDREKQPYEGENDSLEQLRREIQERKNETDDNRETHREDESHTDDIDALHKEVLQAQDEKNLDLAHQQESAELHKEIRASVSKIAVTNGRNIVSPEEMDEDQIAERAQE